MSSAGNICRVSDAANLEDDIGYVLRKAMRGVGKTPAQVAEVAGLSIAELDACIAGRANTNALHAVASALSLSPLALSALPQYRPIVPILQGVTRLEVPFESDTVNSWLIRVEDQTLLFDTGFQPDSVHRLLQVLGAADVDVFLTHDHRDHVGGLAALAPLMRKHQHIPLGQSLTFGPLRVKSIDLAGHCIPTTGYVIEGLSRPICVTGDALFAGSIGGCPDPFTYQMALRNIHQHLLCLPNTTILLPGHGPATTVGQEKKCNPFLV